MRDDDTVHGRWFVGGGGGAADTASDTTEHQTHQQDDPTDGHVDDTTEPVPDQVASVQRNIRVGALGFRAGHDHRVVVVAHRDPDVAVATGVRIVGGRVEGWHACHLIVRLIVTTDQAGLERRV